MRIPSDINENVLKTYELPNSSSISDDTSNHLQSADFQIWDKRLPKPLHDICIEAIANNWMDNPIFEEIPLSCDRHHLVDILSTDLPLALTIAKINDDVYWKKCYHEKWSKNLPRKVNEPDVFEIVKSDNSRNHGSARSFKVSNGSNKSGSIGENEPSLASTHSSDGINRNSKSNYVLKNRTWKEYFIEMYVKCYLEELKPENYDATQMKELSDLCAPFLKVLRMDQMQCSEKSASRIPMNSVVSGFQNLQEFSLCFKQRYVGENFSWKILETSLQDITLLSKGLEKLRLQIIRIRNSDINCEKLVMILKALSKHEIRVLDFSYCKIADRGMTAISKFLIDVPVEEVILTNNRIGPSGMEPLSYVLLQPTCKIKRLDLGLNQIADNGGNLLLGALTTEAKSLKSLLMPGCGLINIASLGKMLRKNHTLEELHISNNNIGEIIGQSILEAMKHNVSIKKIDLRMCKIPPSVEFSIQEMVYENRKSRTLPSTGRVEEEVDLTTENEVLVLEMENILK